MPADNFTSVRPGADTQNPGMRAAFHATISLLLVLMAAMPIHAAKIDDDITLEQLLASRCAGGGGPTGTASVFCAARDVAVKELEKQGWCRSRSEQWRECHPGAHSTHDRGAPADHANGDRRVRIFPSWSKPDPGQAQDSAGNPRFFTGDTLLPKKFLWILYLDEPCHLPLVDTKGMYAAVEHAAYWIPGCWYPTLDHGFVFIMPDGKTMKQPSWEGLPHALLHSDGSATITEPNYDSDTFSIDVMQRQIAAQMEQMRGAAPSN
jgi:hypothetical protein